MIMDPNRARGILGPYAADDAAHKRPPVRCPGQASRLSRVRPSYGFPKAFRAAFLGSRAIGKARR
jgi:hypothetical protein